MEPNISSLPPQLQVFPHLTLSSYAEALMEPELIVVLVDHDEFADLYRQIPDTALVVDTIGKKSHNVTSTFS